ncbi:hypothetical protein SNL152K_3460 [Streptomyces sp. NL15-2K]|nr:hypothetical protein SNL152K_3460 [Streptomyces sp. NL15-2K]
MPLQGAGLHLCLGTDKAVLSARLEPFVFLWRVGKTPGRIRR